MQNPRLESVFIDTVDALRRVIREHGVTLDEWRLAVGWLNEAGTQPNEIPLVLDVLFGTTVDDVNSAVVSGTENTVEGPFYVAGAPLLSSPYRLPMREDEPGERLHLSGSVRSVDGAPLAGAMLDIWQISADGGYSHFHPGFPEHNLRGRLTTGEDGAFAVEAVVPPPYEIPKDGATGRLLAALGRTAFRPGHLHLRLSAPGHHTLTTQVFFEGDPWLDRDVVAGATKPSLVTALVRENGAARASYDFVLEPLRALSRVG
ncbi:MAG TPA: dioxygenase [Candidatus Dormibacteraeota bacterium]|nr:dioxygenase [Candidatus Dormibacteraeota bacterium]